MGQGVKRRGAGFGAFACLTVAVEFAMNLRILRAGVAQW